MDSITKRFGENLKYNRKLMGLTQIQLAESVGINLRQLARIESGESFVTSDTLQKLCNILNIQPKALFELCSNQQKINNESLQKDKEFKEFYKNVAEIIQDKNKVKFVNLACKALNNKKAVKELKAMIEGMELVQK